ncbi:MAG: amidase [Acidimicrobiia bacterium]|nr:amidase [Acidimicrobiia bacterium]
MGEVPATMPSATEAADAMARGDYTATQLLERCRAEIEARNDELNAFVVLDLDRAAVAAAEVDRRRAAGEPLGPFAGVPLGVKDLEDCEGLPTSHGSLLYKDGPAAPADSLHLARLRAAGAIPIGKTAAPEFGTVHFTRTKAWGVTRNPWDTSRTPGGSSGGSAAAVAAGMVPFATASDGGGSTRIPASFSGLVGFKPSFGRIPHPAADPSQTAVDGVEVTTVADAARHLDVTAGPDARDRTSLPAPTIRYADAAEAHDVSGLRVGWSADLGFAAVDPQVAELSRAAAEAAATAAGAELVEVDVTLTDPVRTWLAAGAFSLWLAIDPAAHWPGRADDLTPFVRRGLEATAELPVPALVGSLNRRLQLEADCARIFERVDVLCTPTTACVAFDADGRPPMEIGGVDLVERYGLPAAGAMSVPFTMLANLCWNPACSVPAGLDADGLPVGLQFVGRHHADHEVLRLARLAEQASPWPRHAPRPA